VSHNKERIEKNCLNCGEIVAGRYCQHCGQENVVPDLTFTGLVAHFFYDITHFDGKFFITVKKLFTFPGSLSAEYIKGRRATYLDPARMYLFTSAVFFFLFYGIFLHVSEKDLSIDWQFKNDLVADLVLLEKEADFELQNSYIIKNKRDTLVNLGNKGQTLQFRDSISNLVKQIPDSVSRPKLRLLGAEFSGNRAAYDSLQDILPSSAKDTWFKRQMIYQQIYIDKEFSANTGAYIAHLVDKFLHGFPTIFFLSLPLLTLVLKLLYIRNKQIPTANHGIYLVHIYIFTFLWMILYFSIDELYLRFPLTILKWLKVAAYVWLIVYYYKAFKNFYGQGWIKTGIKTALSIVLSFIVLFILSTVYFGYTALKV
jgi:hypothetical protein